MPKIKSSPTLKDSHNNIKNRLKDSQQAVLLKQGSFIVLKEDAYLQLCQKQASLQEIDKQHKINVPLWKRTLDYYGGHQWYGNPWSRNINSPLVDAEVFIEVLLRGRKHYVFRKQILEQSKHLTEKEVFKKYRITKVPYLLSLEYYELTPILKTPSKYPSNKRQLEYRPGFKTRVSIEGVTKTIATKDAYDLIVAENYSSEKMRSAFGITLACWNNTLNYYKDQAWRSKESRSRRYALSKLGNTHGKRPVVYTVPKEVLTTAIKKGIGFQKIREDYNLSDFLLYRNIAHYGLWKDVEHYMEVPARRLFEENDKAFLTTLYPEISPILEDSTIKADKLEFYMDEIRKVQIDLLAKARTLTKIGKEFRNIHNKKNPLSKNNKNFTVNYGEMAFEEMLNYYKVRFKTQIQLEKYYFDYILLDYNILVEIDGSSHKLGLTIKGSKSNDLTKTRIALQKGFNLTRIPFESFPNEACRKRFVSSVESLLSSLHIPLTGFCPSYFAGVEEVCRTPNSTLNINNKLNS